MKSAACDTDSVTKMLVRVPNWIGDAVMCTPALLDLRANFPAATMTVLARPAIGDLLREHPAVDEVFVYDHRGVHRTGWGKVSLAMELRQRAFDVAVLLQNAFEAACLAALAGIPERWGYATDGRALLLTAAVPVPPPRRFMHQVLYYRGLLEDLGLRTGTEGPRLVVTPEEEHALARRFPELATARHVICLNPGSVYGTAKRWLPERFAWVADRLVEECRSVLGDGTVRCVIVGGKGEEALGRTIGTLMRTQPVVLSGETTIRELMCVVKRSLVFLTNDTGPMHIADAFGIPIVAVFGSTDPRTTAPYRAGYRLVRSPVSCAPCLLRHCPIDHRCMTQISAEEVFQAARAAVLAGSSPVAQASRS